MCGIVGRVNSSPDKAVVAEELQTATRLVAHRGPDGEGVHLGRGVGLGHRRLSIVDVAGGAQPMTNAAGTVVVVFNGEIYNHQALRGVLEARGFRFRTHSDTEVLVHGYEAFGDELPRHLQGMFAFAVWDVPARRLLLARDRVGIKPLYWTRAGEDLLFASEVKSLFAFAEVGRALEPAQLAPYLALRYVPAPETLFKGIHRLLPGHLATFEGGRFRVSRYWDVPVDAAPRQAACDEREQAERLSALLQQTVRGHLMGEVPVGLLLSGGLDSTAVGWAMRQETSGPLKSFSVGFEGGEDELPWARSAARALGCVHREVRLSALEFGDSLGELVWHLDEPNADGACVPLFHLARRAREEVGVVLSGEGADELFAGYGIHRRMLAIERAQQRGGIFVSGVAKVAQKVIRHDRVRRYLGMLQTPLHSRYFGVGRAFSDEAIAQVFGREALEALEERFAPLWARSRAADPLHRMLYADTRVWLPDDLLHKADRMTMGSSLELRVPFLDHLLLEHAWQLPASLKVRGGVGKFLLRQAMADKLPASILQRPKRGFAVPLSRWLKGPLYGACREQLLSVHGFCRTLLGPRAIVELLEQHRGGLIDRSEELYALWVLERWHHTWLSAAVGRCARNVVRSAPALWEQVPQGAQVTP
jgi:asparagine synthase (glutamine-hydrolysing)